MRSWSRNLTKITNSLNYWRRRSSWSRKEISTSRSRKKKSAFINKLMRRLSENWPIGTGASEKSSKMKWRGKWLMIGLGINRSRLSHKRQRWSKICNWKKRSGYRPLSRKRRRKIMRSWWKKCIGRRWVRTNRMRSRRSRRIFWISIGDKAPSLEGSIFQWEITRLLIPDNSRLLDISMTILPILVHHRWMKTKEPRTLSGWFEKRLIGKARTPWLLVKRESGFLMSSITCPSKGIFDRIRAEIILKFLLMIGAPCPLTKTTSLSTQSDRIKCIIEEMGRTERWIMSNSIIPNRLIGSGSGLSR